MCTKSYSHVVDRGLTRLADADDFRVVSVDGTFKFLMNVIGQPAHGHSRGDGGSSDDIHVVMTARSLSGCVFFAEALFSENVRRISEKLEAIPRFAVQLELLHVDRLYDWDILFVHKLFPNLQAVAGDAWHLVFEASSCYGESQKPPVIVHLKAIQHKWAAGGTSQWLSSTPYYRQGSARTQPLTRAEASCVTASSLSMKAAKAALANVDPDVPYQSRFEFLSYLAALHKVYPEDMRRKTAKGGKTLDQIVCGAMRLSYVEYIANGARYRVKTGMSREEMAPGTTGNEGSHFDLKAWAWNVQSKAKSTALTTLNFWVLSQLGRHFANQRWMIERNTGSRGEPFLHMLLKVRNPSVCKGVSSKSPSKTVLSRNELKRKVVFKRPSSQGHTRRRLA